MKVPIPDDWDGVSWECYQIQWPKSDLWRGVFLGLLSYPMRGRFWDDRSGIIRDAQAVAWQIWTRDSNLVPCVVCDDCDDSGNPPSQPGIAGMGGESDGLEENDDMSNVTWLSIEGGVLYMYFGPCCKQPVGSIADLLEFSGDPGDAPLEVPGEPAPVYDACGKATAIVNAVYSVLYELHAATSEWDWPWQILPNAERRVGYNLGNVELARLYADWLALGLAGYGPDDVFSPSDRAATLCALQYVFSDDAAGVPDDATYEAIQSAFKTRHFLYEGMVMVALKALGRGNLDTIAKLGAADVGDCSCGTFIDPSATTPDANGWFLGPNLADTVQVYDGSGWSVAYALHTATEPIYGSFLVIRSINDGSDIKRMGMASAEGGFPAQTYDVSMWSDSSDHLEAMNQANPQISDVGAAVQQSLAGQRGYYTYVNGGSNGVNMPVVATPEVTTGQVVGWRLDFIDTEGLIFGDTFEILELRAIHNLNHP